MAKKIKKFLALVLVFGLVANLAMVTGMAAGKTYIYNSSEGHGNSNKMPFDKKDIVIYFGDSTDGEGLSFDASGSGTWKAVSDVGELNLGDGSRPIVIVYTNAQGVQHYYAALVKHSGGNQSDSGGATDNYEFAARTDIVTISGSKTWVGDEEAENVRPDSITVNLLANGEVVDSAVVTADDNWEYSFEALKYINGAVAAYSVEEEAVEGYVASYAGYNITNTHTPAPVDPPVNPEPETTSVTVNKVWNDAEDKDGLRPGSISVQLYADGEAYGEPVTLDADNNWTYTWENLAKNAGDAVIEYTVDEVEVPAGYTKDVDGYTITNSHTPVEEPAYVPTHTFGSIVVTKVAEGAAVPAIATFQLQKSVDEAWVNVGAAVAYSAFAEGSYTFGDLAEGTYRVVEASAEVDGYTLVTTYTGSAVLVKNEADNGDTSVTNGSITVSNVYTKEETPEDPNLPYVPTHTSGSIVVNKTSTGAVTPASATFQLQKLVDGNWVDEGAAVVYGAFADGSYTFTDLAEGTYRVVEAGAEVDGYTLVTSTTGSAVLIKTTADNGDTTVSSGSITVSNVYTEKETTEELPYNPPMYRPVPPVVEEEFDDPDVPLVDAPEEEFGEEDVPLAGAPEEEEMFEEDVPLADVPATGDMTAIWAAASVVSAAGVLFLGKKNKDEE
ncbi:MAG: Cna B-type domain-containing protein [Oscillospiraceae bacterium]|nr:Cna B-type domain-containing protein [Oscillospiraceae bacterium]